MCWLAIDPGVDTGWAWLSLGGDLVACGLGDPKPHPIYGIPRAVIIELPKVYPNAKAKGDPNDLIKLAVQVGGYRERFRSCGTIVNLFWPHTWKGTLPKDIHHARIHGELSPQEQDVLARSGQGVAPSKRHNIIDAVGLAKWGFANGGFASGVSQP